MIKIGGIIEYFFLPLIHQCIRCLIKSVPSHPPLTSKEVHPRASSQRSCPHVLGTAAASATSGGREASEPVPWLCQELNSWTSIGGYNMINRINTHLRPWMVITEGVWLASTRGCLLQFQPQVVRSWPSAVTVSLQNFF